MSGIELPPGNLYLMWGLSFLHWCQTGLLAHRADICAHSQMVVILATRSVRNCDSSQVRYMTLHFVSSDESICLCLAGSSLPELHSTQAQAHLRTTIGEWWLLICDIGHIAICQPCLEL